MFVLEIGFKDNLSQPEILIVRRLQALIGASEDAHVVIDDMKSLNFQILISRFIGRQFFCKLVPRTPEDENIPKLETELFDGIAFLDLGVLRLSIVSLEPDLLIKAGEPPDRAGIRILKQACSLPTPMFPAVVALGENPFVLSFQEGQSVYVGRSNKCLVRFDTSDISNKHLRIGYENGEFWVEDLGSTNGTFVNDRQISGHVNIPPKAQVFLGMKTSICGVESSKSLNEVLQLEEPVMVQEQKNKYPILYSLSEVARPARLVLSEGKDIVIGRDPNCDLWLGAPHVSRRHCIFHYSSDGIIHVSDTSTNGTVHDTGTLAHGESIEIIDTPKVFNFGGNLTVALCFNEEQEKRFEEESGSIDTFYTLPPTERNRVSTGRALTDMLNQPPPSLSLSAGDQVFEKVSQVNFDVGEEDEEYNFKKYFMSFSLPKKLLWVGILALANILVLVFLISI